MSLGARPLDQACSTGATSPASDLIGLIDHLRIVRQADELAALVAGLGMPERPMVVSFLNQHGVNLAWTDPAFARLLRHADHLLRDGLGVGVCLRALGREGGLNMNGTDLIPMIVRAHAGRRVALFGTRQPWLDRAATALQGMGCDVVATLDGFQSDAAYIAATVAHRPDLLILAMGMPRQEQVAASVADAVEVPLLIVNGGAIADFLAGRFPRAPRWMRKSGLEWAFRLGREPTRLWRRYGTGGAMFAARVLMLRRADRARRRGRRL